MSSPGHTPLDPPERNIGQLRRRRMLWISAAAAVILAAVAIGIVWWAGSSACENLVRRRLIAQIEAATGGRAEIAGFHWGLMHLTADATGIVIHGREAANEAPYARIGRIHVGISILGFLSPHVLLRDL